MIISLTQHSIQRARERLNLSEKSLQRTAQRAFEEGMHHDLAPRLIREWALGKLASGRGNANHIRIVGHQAFTFSDAVLLTVLLVPKELMPRPKRRREYDLAS